jgi:membrane associated rhomboid family serine protease
MLSRTFRMLQEFPVTWMMLFISPLLWMLDIALSTRLQITYEEATRLLGGPDELALWDGAWWPIFTAPFHHGGFIHLILNMSFLGVVGRQLEVRLGSIHYLIFCVAALAVSGVAQAFWSPAVGLSGLAYAQFGLVWVWRKSDPRWKTEIPDELIQLGFIWFFGCFVVDWLGIIPIANVAHAAGLGYGCLIAITRYGGPRARLWWPILLFSHLFLIPLFYLVTHPVWNGKYHWRLGDDDTKRPMERIRHYENAVRCDPDLEGPWRNLALLHEEERDIREAWRCILNGLVRHPSSQDTIQVVRRIARYFVNPNDRANAMHELKKIFGEQSQNWEGILFDQLEGLPQLGLPPARQPAKKVIDPDGQIDEPPLPELPTILPRRALDEIPHSPTKLPAPDPDAAGSAEEGRAA